MNVHDCFLILFQSMSAASGGSNPVANYKFSDSEISKLLNIPLDQIAESNQDVPAQKANPDSGKSSSQCDNQNFLPKVRKSRLHFRYVLGVIQIQSFTPPPRLDYLRFSHFHFFMDRFLINFWGHANIRKCITCKS